MTITITDPVLAEQLRAANGVVQLRDAEGNFLMEASLPRLGTLPPGVSSPFTDEQLAARRGNRSGRSLTEIMRDLEARG